MTKAAGTRRKKGRTAAPRSRRPKGRAKVRRWAWGLSAAAFLVVPLLLLWVWARASGPGSGKVLAFEVSEGSTHSVPTALAARGAIASPRLFRAYWTLLRPTAALAPGTHVLNDALSPSELLDRLARSRFRPTARVTLVEGFHQEQVLARLEKSEVVSRLGVLQAATLRQELGIEGTSFEGYFAPATYDLYVDADPKEVVRLLVRATRKRIERVAARHPGAMAALEQRRGWGEHEILTLASIVEKETAQPDERPLIASVYLNRLDDPAFVPRGRLQADPTAAYPCQVATGTGRPSTCSEYDRGGKVTPRMLRDATNAYNTYLRAGLPPGPICSPSDGAIEAVLSPAKSDYLFFVASGSGRHTFSRTFGEHNDAVRGR